MENLLIITHIVLAIGIILLVLLQRGKGAEAGASFGAGASQTILGSQGSSSTLAKLTSILAILFVITSIALTKVVFNNTNKSDVIKLDNSLMMEQDKKQEELEKLPD